MKGTPGRPASPRLLAVVLTAALALAGLGVALLAIPRARPVGAARAPWQAGDLVVWVMRAAWIGHEHDGPGRRFPMPPSMMPGMPAEGRRRLHVELTVGNAGDRPAAFVQGEFALRAERASWPPSGGTPDRARIAPGARLDADLFFDVPGAPGELYLTRVGWEGAVRIAADGAAAGGRGPDRGGIRNHEHEHDHD